MRTSLGEREKAAASGVWSGFALSFGEILRGSMRFGFQE